MLGGENEHVILVRLSFLKGKELCHDYYTAFVCCVCMRAFVTAFQLRNYSHELYVRLTVNL